LTPIKTVWFWLLGLFKLCFHWR